ncbi:MAG: flavodoxin-dependent (E)-4-hydroxy-3-methylbut-2-enyl-diphosphate synthase [Erysipelotrichaceae bacterium]|nr:flavodoxin-dependent (E)-4-hydroxy-3-methylbut-2-enyl-diphosphate synthase [Erysipelotrichaceae bacterium]
MERNQTRAIKVGNIQIGNQNKVIIQSMTNTKTKNVEETVAQINLLEKKGCQIVRLAVFDEKDAYAIKEIKEKVNIPLVADIHFNYKYALIALDCGIDKIRINPGNIGKRENVEAVVSKCKERNVPIRIGINSGSLERELLEKYGKPCAEAMIESAKKHIEILESMDFYDICLSFKSSNVLLTIEAYELASKTFNYPLHLGVTEAGTFNTSAIKSSAALGTLLYKGIGDTMRISVSGPPEEEMIIAKQLLKSFELIDKVPNLISCPTCGRIQYDMIPIVKEIESFINEIEADIEVAIMGCAVNGPQEASRADIGIAGGREIATLFRHGKAIRQVPQAELLETLKEEILNIVDERSKMI